MRAADFERALEWPFDGSHRVFAVRGQVQGVLVMEILAFFLGALLTFAPALFEILLVALGVTSGAIPT
jgi:hypothetical protein